MQLFPRRPILPKLALAQGWLRFNTQHQFVLSGTYLNECWTPVWLAPSQPRDSAYSGIRLAVRRSGQTLTAGGLEQTDDNARGGVGAGSVLM